MFVGSWVQDHFGTLETAKEKALITEKANGNKIKVEVCEFRGIELPTYEPTYWKLAKE
jgi:hypothetical protein